MVAYLYDFNGTDTAYGQLPAPGGYPAWQIVNGSWRRWNNRAYTSTSDNSNPVAVVEIGNGDVDCSATVSSSGGDAVYFRVQDANNWIRAKVYCYTSSSSYTTTEYEWFVHYQEHHGQFDDDVHQWHIFYQWTSSNTNPPYASPSISHAHYGGDGEDWYSDDYWHTHYRDSDDGPGLTGNTRTQTHYSSYTRRYVYLEKCVDGTITTLDYDGTGSVTKIRVKAVGSTIQVFYNGSTTASMTVSDSTFSTVARHGIGRGATSNDGQNLDNFYIDPLNTAPTAPTLNLPNVVNVNSTTRLPWQFSDPDVGDRQGMADFYYRPQGTTTWQTVTINGSTTYWDAPAGTFTAGTTYECQVVCYDAAGLESPRSSSDFFIAAEEPDTPSILSPADGSQVGETGSVEFEPAGQMDSFQVRTVANNAGQPDPGTVYYDSGVVNEAATRILALEFPVNGRIEHIQVRTAYLGLWSEWASVRVDVSYTKPSAPIPILTVNQTEGSLTIQVINPTPAAGAPGVVQNEIWVDDGPPFEDERKAVVNPNGAFVYMTPVSARDYEDGHVRIVALATNGTTQATTTGTTTEE